MDAASDLHAPISACRFDVPVQFSRKLRPFRPPVVPSSVRVSQNFLPKWMPLQESSFALVALAFQFRAHAHSGLPLFLPQQCAPEISWPIGCHFSTRLLPCSSDIPQHTVSVAGLQFCPPQCAQAKISALNGCRSRISTFTFQCNVPATLPFSSDPMGRPFEYFICAFLPRPLAIPSRPQTQFQPPRPQQHFIEATFAMGSAPKFSPCPQPHGPHLSLGGSGICSNICST